MSSIPVYTVGAVGRRRRGLIVQPSLYGGCGSPRVENVSWVAESVTLVILEKYGMPAPVPRRKGCGTSFVVPSVLTVCSIGLRSPY